MLKTGESACYSFVASQKSDSFVFESDRKVNKFLDEIWTWITFNMTKKHYKKIFRRHYRLIGFFKGNFLTLLVVWKSPEHRSDHFTDSISEGFEKMLTRRDFNDCSSNLMIFFGDEYFSRRVVSIAKKIDSFAKVNSADRLYIEKCFKKEIKASEYANLPIYSKGRETEFLEWNGHYFRSPQELAIAKELDSRNLLFFPNAGCRVNEGSEQKTREVDFLVCVDGNWGILECDSDTYHTSAAKDHKRDEVFNRNGIWFIRRFTSDDCKNPKVVVDTFLGLMQRFFEKK